MRLIGACEQTPCPFWNWIDDPVKRFRCAGLLSRDLLRGVIFLVAGDEVRIPGVVTPVGKNRAESQVLTLTRWALSLSVNGKGGFA
jgi:hypothetical protein